MGYRWGTLATGLLGVVLLAGCSADVSHPSALRSAAGIATSAPPVAAPSPPTTASAPVSPPSRPAESSSAPVSASPSGAISGTPTSSAVAPLDPASADVIATQVRATARAFIDDFNIALATGNVAKIEALTSPTCGCRTLVNTIKQLSAKGERYDGVAFTLKSTDVTFLAAGASGEITYSISPGRVLDATGKEVNASGATPDGDADLFIMNVDGRWIVQQSILLGANDQ